MIAFVIIVAVIAALFIVTHLRQMTPEEVLQLARVRRTRKINAYYSFSHQQTNVNLDFKKTMKADGRFHQVNHSLSEFPSLAAGLLKYKKHEWMLLAFERQQRVFLMWFNKGPDGTKVSLQLPFQQVISIAVEQQVDTVLWFHNHPNPNPSRYSCAGPSTTDLASARLQAIELNSAKVNLLDFVCERGNHHEYYRSIADNFTMIHSFAADICRKNGTSWWVNLSLHCERVFAPSRDKKGYKSAAIASHLSASNC